MKDVDRYYRNKVDRYFRNKSFLEEAILSMHEPIRRDDGKIVGHGACILKGIKSIELGQNWRIQGPLFRRDTIEIVFADGTEQTFIDAGDN